MKLSVLPIRFRITPRIRFQRKGAMDWFWHGAPCLWTDRTEIEFKKVPFERLVPAQSFRDPDRVEFWKTQIRQGRSIPALVVTDTGGGYYYVHDGNHRFSALEQLWEEGLTIQVEVAEVIPCIGYAFHPVRLGCPETGWYSTHVLAREIGAITERARGASTTS